MYLLIPMSGQGSRFKAHGFLQPKPMIPVSGEAMIDRLLQCFPQHWKAVFVLSEEHKTTGLESLLRRLRPDSQIVYVEPHKAGPSYAALKGLQFIPEGQKVLISYCDYGMVWNSYQFEKFIVDTNCDACVVSYRGFHPHYLSPTMYAYSRIDNNRVVEIKEKGSFTNNRENEFASCGAYFFKDSTVLRNTIERQIAEKYQFNGEYYTSLTVQMLLMTQPQSLVNIFEIPFFFQWGTPQDLKNFEYWENTFKKYNQFNHSEVSVDQVLMPMAGAGSRFSALTKIPKPLILINQIPMYKWALRSLPKALKKNHFVVHSDFVANVPESQSEITVVSQVTQGQAITAQIAIEQLNDNQDIIVSSCDHTIVLNPEKWNQFKRVKDIDAAIFVIKGFPGTSRTPQSYAYVQVDENDVSAFKKVNYVSVKKQISENPVDDFLLVGTFWFKDKSIMQTGIQQIIDKNKRVNNEYYLDSIFEELILLGKKVAVIELDGYINWGDPQSFLEAAYWHECFAGFKLGRPW